MPHESDQQLVAQCLVGDASSLTALDEILRREVRRAVTPLDDSGTLVDEVTQLARERLLLPAADGRSRLQDWSGDAPLAAWLRAMAVRLALNAKRPGGRELPVGELPDAPLADPDPELALLRARYRDAFKTAFTTALGELQPRDRTLLRLTAIDGLTCAQVGQMYAKDASTISRWVSQVRAVLLQRTRLLLTQSLALSESALDSVMRAADSELAFSLSKLLE